MTTPLQIITQSLKKAGVLGIGQAAQAEDADDAFADLNDMIAQWAQQRWLIYHLVDVAKVSTGAQSYTVGPGGDFNVTLRPDRLEAAFFRQVIPSQPNMVDYPLTILEAREDYNRIALKQLQSFSRYIFYDAAYPLGVVYPWPVPQATLYELHLTLKAVLTQFTTLTQDIILPPVYMAALKYNLTVRLRQSYQLPSDPVAVALATSALAIIRASNTQIARLTMPRGLSMRRGSYNIYSDQSN